MISTKKSAIFTAVAAIFLLTGCAGFNKLTPGSNLSGFNFKGQTKSDLSEKSRTQALIESGVEYLESGDFVKAQQVFNVGLKFDIQSVPLHFFNALTYHLKYEKGDPESFKLAEAGYQTAIGLDPTMDLAHLQLGRLYISSKRYNDAKLSFANAVDIKVKKPEEALIGLAQSALLSGDTNTSVWAVKQLDELKWNDARLYRLKAFQAAIAKQPVVAREMLEKYASLEKNTKESRYVGNRIDQLVSVKTTYSPDNEKDVHVALAKTDEPKPAEKNESKDEAKDIAPKANWFSCDLRPSPVMEKDTTLMHPHTQPGGGDDGYVTAALPMPCDGQKPPVAVIEITMIRTEEKSTNTYGINLLESLRVAGAVRYSGGVQTSNFRDRTIYTDPGTDAISTGILSYSLNIANSLYEKNEVVARPTLAAIDRLPALFFSGTNYSVGVGSTNAGYSLVDRQVGISLSVTPTFINDEEILLSVRASRSFLEDGATPPVVLVQTKNTVNGSALLKYGQTFIMNGLVEREKDVVQSGTPLFQEIPILQYFFKNSITVDYNRQILTLVTVRKIIDSDEEMQKAKNKEGLISRHKLSSQVQQFIDLQSSVPVLDEVFSSLAKDNFLYRRLKQRDLIQESVSSKHWIQRMIVDLKEMAYF